MQTFLFNIQTCMFTLIKLVSFLLVAMLPINLFNYVKNNIIDKDKENKE